MKTFTRGMLLKIKLFGFASLETADIQSKDRHASTSTLPSRIGKGIHRAGIAPGP